MLQLHQESFLCTSVPQEAGHTCQKLKNAGVRNYRGDAPGTRGAPGTLGTRHRTHQAKDVRRALRVDAGHATLGSVIRDPGQATCPVCICPVGMNVYSTSRGDADERPQEQVLHRGQAGRALPSWGPTGSVLPAEHSQLGHLAQPLAYMEDLEVAAVCGAAPPLTTADGRVCNDRSLTPLVGTGD